MTQRNDGERAVRMLSVDESAVSVDDSAVSSPPARAAKASGPSAGDTCAIP
jgi:hypothetical protein